MTDTAADDASTQTFFFIRGVEEDAGEGEWPDDAEKVRQALGESLNASNVASALPEALQKPKVFEDARYRGPVLVQVLELLGTEPLYGI